jgi:hypothetical protein
MHRSAYELLLFRINDALTALRLDPNPTAQQWVEIASAVNTMHALHLQGKILDPDNLINDALTAMREAQTRAENGKPYRLNATGLQAIIGLLQDYTEACAQLPERTLKSAINFAYNARTTLRNPK